MNDANRWIERLALLPHPEGGWYRETYRSPLSVAAAPLASPPTAAPQERSAITSILFLLADAHVSHLHRIDGDELWYWHAGETLTLELLHADGRHERRLLGPEGELQVAVSAGTWFGAHLATKCGWCLVGCAVAPGFEFSGFELGTRAEMLDLFPGHAALIALLTPAT